MLFPLKFYFKNVYEPCLAARKHFVQCTVKNSEQTARRIAQREVRLKERISNQVIQNPGFLEMTQGMLGNSGRCNGTMGVPLSCCCPRHFRHHGPQLWAWLVLTPKTSANTRIPWAFWTIYPQIGLLHLTLQHVDCSVQRIPREQHSLLAWSSPAGTSVFSFYRK